MKVDFNNVRKQAIYAYNSLVEKLNTKILTKDQYVNPKDIYHDYPTNIKGYVLIDAYYIQGDLDTLRQMIGTIAGTYEEENEDFKDMFEEVYPNEDQHMEFFNRTEED